MKPNSNLNPWTTFTRSILRSIQSATSSESVIPANAMSQSAVIKTIVDLRDRGRLSGVDVANITRVSKATVSRWSNGIAAPHPRTQLILSDLRYVVDRLAEFYTADETRLWLYARNDLLAGKTAIDLIHEDRTDEVLQAIEKLDSLAYL